jgi:glyoxylase-like metal-dependent hydrolase (beta-lactamase superfamily II)
MTFRPRLQPDGRIEQALDKFDLTPSDIRHVIITHFHADHISGLRRFTNAQFIVDRAAAQSVLSGSTISNLRHGVFKELLPSDFAERLIDMRDQPIYSEHPNLPDGLDVFGDQSVIAVPLPGHTHSHFGVYFPTLTRPLLYATDVQWLRTALMNDRLPGFPASISTADVAQARRSAEYVRDFAQSGGDVILCHDPEKTAWDL